MDGHAAVRRRSGADTLVIFVHGIQGSPRQFDWLVSLLPDHVDYECALLPGHGATVYDFRKYGAADWEAHVRGICEDAAKRYQRILYVGHSMGCLLGILAAEAGIHFDSMLLLACPLALRPTLKYFINNYRAVSEGGMGDPYADAVRQANSVCADSSWQYLFCVRPYLELLKLIRAAKRVAAKLDVPVLLLHSEEDEIVSGRSMNFFRDMPNVRADVLPDCGHFLYTCAAKRQISKEMLRLL